MLHKQRVFNTLVMLPNVRVSMVVPTVGSPSLKLEVKILSPGDSLNITLLCNANVLSLSIKSSYITCDPFL